MRNIILPLFLLTLLIGTGCSKGRADDTAEAAEKVILPENILYAQLKDGTRASLSGLPDDVEVTAFYPYGDGEIFCATMGSGLFRKSDQGWQQVLDETFKRKTMLEGVDEFRKVTGFARSKQDPGFMAVAVKHALYISRDNGASWIKVEGRIQIEDYITALEIDSSGRIWIGTSYNGIFCLDGDSYDNISRGLYYEPYAGDVVFYETVARIEEIDGKLYASQLFNRGLYCLDDNTWTTENFPGGTPVSYVQDLFTNEGNLYGIREDGIFSRAGGTWHKEADLPGDASFLAGLGTYNNSPFMFRHHIMEGRKRSPSQKKAAGRKAIYTNVHMLKANPQGLIRVIKKSHLNAIVIDVKDDNGDILAKVPSETAADIGALSRTIDFAPYLKMFHDEGIYVIARMVTFKDKRLFRAYEGKYAIWDSSYDRPWRARNREFWCDPHSDFVRSYNIELASLVGELGFDEIQFDYIRFPADGPLERCEYRYRKDPEMFKSEVLDDFLQEAKAEISVPISVDIYGFTAFYNFGNRIGQDIEVFGKHVDAVSAMIYPSHYGYRFYMKGPREERPYRIVYDTGIRSRFLSNDRAIMRPYVQAFDMKSPTFGTGYIKYQVDASDESGCDGYIFWHAGGSYGVVRRALSDTSSSN